MTSVSTSSPGMTTATPSTITGGPLSRSRHGPGTDTRVFRRYARRGWRVALLPHPGWGRGRRFRGTAGPLSTPPASRRCSRQDVRRMDDLARDGRGRCDVRAREAQLGVRRAHPATEVAVRGRDRTLARGQDAHVAAEAGAAGGGRDARSGLDEDVEQTLAHRLPVDALGGWNDDRATVGVHAAAAQDLRRLPEVGHRPVRAVADVDLV